MRTLYVAGGGHIHTESIDGDTLFDIIDPLNTLATERPFDRLVTSETGGACHLAVAWAEQRGITVEVTSAPEEWHEDMLEIEMQGELYARFEHDVASTALDHILIYPCDASDAMLDHAERCRIPATYHDLSDGLCPTINP